ncbi:glycosyltransferase family 4 protein [Oceanobacter mangrovi]|uniref:glycosyltransferase family 4 protein n=1 Tax=Oceanobacter mangrovi TaxID=2862510 RepID=UPI001C8E3039|nr:glycosyltransferase family 1 protein [Oceanobacter mangrovi]
MNDGPKRVSIVTETFAPEINGVAHTLAQLVAGMQALGIEVQVIRPAQHRNDKSFHEPLLQTVTLPGLPIPGYKELRFGIPFTGRISSALKRFQPDAVYVATEGPMGYSAVRAAKKAGIPVWSGFHTNFHQYIEHYRLKGLEKIAYRYLRYFHNLTDGTLVPTRLQRDQLEAHGFHNVQVLSRGVDSQLFNPERRSEPLRRSWGATESDLVLLYVGRIAGEKNMELALSSYRRLRNADERVKLVLVGDGPELPAIQAQYPEVICCGMQRGEALATHYASGDIFLFPSKTDTFGNVVTEAMSSGLAVVSFDYAAGHEHIRSGHTGMLAPFGEDEAFRQQVETLSDSPNLLTRIRWQARQHALGISWSSIVDEFVQRFGAPTEKVTNDGNRKAVTTKNRASVQ